jgi:hypothetical protein
LDKYNNKNKQMVEVEADIMQYDSVIEIAWISDTTTTNNNH